MTTFQMDLADRWLVVPLGDADAVAHWPADLGREPRYEDPDDVEHLLAALPAALEGARRAWKVTHKAARARL